MIISLGCLSSLGQDAAAFQGDSVPGSSCFYRHRNDDDANFHSIQTTQKELLWMERSFVEEIA